jgi:hypothetical protein
MGERILVCGGRDYLDMPFLFSVLDMQAEQGPISTIIQGDCPTGADKLARMWAISRNEHFDSFPADWRAHGKAAGPIRNQQMLDEGKPTKVFVFPGGRGTADMARRAKRAGLPVFFFQPAQQEGEGE